LLHLAGDVQRIAADDDASDAPGGVGSDDELRAVGKHDRHPVALFDTHLPQAGREAVHRLVQLAVGEPGIHNPGADCRAKDGGGVAGVLGRRVLQELIQRDGGIIYRCRHTLIVMLQPGLFHDSSSLSLFPKSFDQQEILFCGGVSGLHLDGLLNKKLCSIQVTTEK
jgi:hypothetical protein